MPRRKQHEDELVLALACGASVASAAAKVGMSPRSVYRRLQDDSFQRRVQETRADLWQRSYGMFLAGRQQMIGKLVALTEPEYPPSVRHAAIRTYLEMGSRTHSQMGWEERLVALERLNAEGRRPGREV